MSAALRLFTVSLLVVLYGCMPALNDQPTLDDAATSSVSQAMSLQEAGDAVLDALAESDMEALAALAHPEKGIRFSPSGHIDAAGDQVFQAAQVAAFLTDSTLYTWGMHDGSGEPIDLIRADYIGQYVWDQDYRTAPETAENEIIGQGNTVVNIDAAYPGASFVEYHFPSFDPQYEGMDWVSLRLIFEQWNGQWYLVGISHDGWTI